METVFLETDLKDIDKNIWQLLAQGVQSFKAPFHTGVVATVHDQLPQLRTVVLRRIDTAGKILYFHTDIRSPKVSQLLQQPLMSWLFYDGPLRMQLRINATALVHTDDAVADHGWQSSRLPSRLTYTSSSPSGTILFSPELIDLNRTEVEPEFLHLARKNFCVVETSVHQLDWVFLHFTGNRRAMFDYRTGERQWIQV
jgi:pyridoxine/pyridoxamine 5'-phosphate oxidase